MHFNNRIIRPPFEKRSKYLQVTIGCSHNTCNFCNYYKNTSFDISSLDEIKSDIIELKNTGYSFRRLWLQSADPFILDTQYLIKIAEYVKEYLPFVESIGSYARIDNLENKTTQDLKKLKKYGYNHIVFGLESGDDKLLEKMNKGYTSNDIHTQLTKMNKAKMDFTLIFLCGLGGYNYGLSHANKTADIINKLEVERIMINSLNLLENTQLYNDKNFIEATEKEKLTETATLINNLDLNTFIDATHASNTINFFGKIPENKGKITEYLQDIINNTSEEELKRKHKKLSYV